MLCKDKSIPAPCGDNNIIFLFIRNMYDGVGDFVHGVTFSKELNVLKKKGYKICALVSTMTEDPLNENCKFTKRANFVKDMLISGKHDFDQWYLMEDLMNKAFDLKEWMTLSQQSDLIGNLNKAAAAFEISYGFNHQELWEHLPTEVKVLKCRQYGSKAPNANPHALDLLTNASMGLSQENCEGLGIKLYSPQIDEKNRSQRLLAISQRNPDFVNQLLCTQHPSIEQAEHYFSSHHFAPAYLQNSPGATAFILTQILKYLHSEGNLEKTCDFLIPANVVDEETLRFFLHGYGFKDSDVAFVTANSNIQDHQNAKIRIISFRIHDDEDYDALFSMTQDGTGCSGDNSTSVCFSNRSLPYFQDKGAGSPLGNFYKTQLIFTLTQEIAQCSDTMLKEGLHNLKNYFEHLIINDSPLLNGLSPIMQIEEGSLSNQNIVEYLTKMYPTEFMRWIEKAACLADSNYINEAWQHFREILLKKYNYFDKFPHVVKTALYLSQTQADIHALLKESAEIQQLFNGCVLTDNNFRQFTVEELILFTASPTIIQGLINKIITPETIRKDFKNLEEYGVENRLHHYHEILSRIESEAFSNNINHIQKLFYAMLLGLDTCNESVFRECFSDPDLLDSYLQNFEQMLNRKLFESVERGNFGNAWILLEKLHANLEVIFFMRSVIGKSVEDLLKGKEELKDLLIINATKNPQWNWIAERLRSQNVLVSAKKENNEYLTLLNDTQENSGKKLNQGRKKLA